MIHLEVSWKESFILVLIEGKIQRSIIIIMTISEHADKHSSTFMKIKISSKKIMINICFSLNKVNN